MFCYVHLCNPLTNLCLFVFGMLMNRENKLILCNILHKYMYVSFGHLWSLLLTLSPSTNFTLVLILNGIIDNRIINARINSETTQYLSSFYVTLHIAILFVS